MSAIDRLNDALAGRYSLQRQVGAGGMATVYLAHDLRHDRPVAIKVLKPDIADAIGADRFLTEIRTTANLQHPHILPLFDSGRAGDALFYVMPYIEGETLRRQLDRGHTPALAEAVRLVCDIADALEYAHRRGVVHRDIKPENILLHEGRPLVADFGIAIGSSDRDATRMTRAGLALGTPGYMSPEQSAGDTTLDGRSDQYSLACVLAELLDQAPAFAGPTTEAGPAAAIARPPAAQGRALAPLLDAALRRARSRLAVDRFPTMAAFADALRSAPGEADEKSIAVLPFANMSGDRENDYFADGVAEEIINALTHLPDLRVAARTSAFSFKGRTDDLRAIGEKLGVRHVLEGSVRKAGNQLRVTAQLVSAADGYQLWSERYDRRLDDVFAIQDEIATAIAARLQVTLASGPSDRLVKPATESLPAYDEYLRGMALMHRRGPGIMEAIECFRRAVALDADYAPALAGLSHALVLSSLWGLVPPQQIREASLDAAARARLADPLLAEAYASTALAAIAVEFDCEKAAAAWDRAVALSPGNVDVRAARAVFHLCYILGDFEGAEREVRLALERDPFNQTAHAQLGLVFAFAGRAAQAIDQAKRAVALDPTALFGRWVQILALLVGGAHDDVIAAGIDIMRKFGRNAWVMLGMAQAYAETGRLEEATAIFDELAARSRTEYVQPGVLAIIAMALGRRDDAMRRWADAAEARDMLMVAMLLHAPNSSALRAQPEHATVIHKLGWDTPPAAPPARS